MKYFLEGFLFCIATFLFCCCVAVKLQRVSGYQNFMAPSNKIVQTSFDRHDG